MPKCQVVTHEYEFIICIIINIKEHIRTYLSLKCHAYPAKSIVVVPLRLGDIAFSFENDVAGEDLFTYKKHVKKTYVTDSTEK